MYNLAILAIIHKLITCFCILVRPRQKLKMFGFIKHIWWNAEEKLHYEKKCMFLRLWSIFLSLPIRKRWCNVSVTCFLVLLKLSRVQFSSVQSLSHVWLFVIPCSMPGLPVHHQLLGFTQTYVHWVGDAIQTSYPLLSPSPPALNLSQHQGLFQWVSSLHQVAKVLEFQLQHQSFLEIVICKNDKWNILVCKGSRIYIVDKEKV